MMWTEEAVSTLTTAWKAGKSSGIIAREMRTTRNTIIGKVHRLGLAGRTTLDSMLRTGRPPIPNKPPRQRTRPGTIKKQGPAPQESFARYPKAPAAILSPPEGQHVTLIDRTGCCFPMNEGGPFLFCNAELHEGSYCEFHHAAMFRKPDQKGK